MYPQRELKQLIAHKARLERRIARQRGDCAEAMERVVQAIEWIDLARSHWHWISPLLKVIALPVGVAAKRAAGRRTRWLGALLRWGPLVMSVLREVKKARVRTSAREFRRTADAV